MARSGPTLPLEVSVLGLIGNCGCGLMALGAGFLDCFRPGRMGSRQAPPGLASSNHLEPPGLRGWKPELESGVQLEPQRLPLGQASKRPAAGDCQGLRGQKDASWPGLAGTGFPLSPQPSTATCNRQRGQGGGPRAWRSAAGSPSSLRPPADTRTAPRSPLPVCL